MRNIWIIADKPEYAYELLSMASSYSENITAFINGDLESAKECFNYGAKSVKRIPLPSNTTWEQYSKVLANESKDSQPELILVAATRRGKSLAAQLAGYIDYPCVTESKSIEIEGDKVTTSRTIYGGLAEKELEAVDQPLIVTVPPGTFAKKMVDSPMSEDISELELCEPSNLEVIERKEKVASTINLADSEIVIGVGRGFGKKENLQYAEELASLLGAELGCSRPVTEDFQWLPEERYIGISGAVIQPKLYIAAGISGQIQHVYGIRDSKTIVAIDKNENAPIFKVSDYYIVGDLQEVLPELISAMK